MKKSKAKELYKLIKRWTRCEIMARHGRFDNLEFANYAIKQIEYKDQIRELVFGTSNIYELGVKWGMIKDKHTRDKIRARRKKRRKR